MLRHHWIRSIGDDRASQLVQSEYWNTLCELLKKSDLLVIDDARPVGGRPSTFFHVKHARDILAERPSPETTPFLADMVCYIRELEKNSS